MSLARQILDNDLDDPSEGLLVPIVSNYFIEAGRNAQYTDEKGIEMVLQLIREQNERIDGRKARKSFGGSSSSSCMRQQILDIRLGTKFVKEPDAKLVSIFEDGVWRNLKWLVIFHRMGIMKEFENTSYDRNTNISWTPDCRLDLSEWYGKDYSDVPVEIKGMHNGEFDNFSRRSGRGRWAAGRTMQVHTYMYAEGAKNWLIWAENKNNQEYEECWMPRDPAIIKYLESRYSYMQRALKSGKLPAIECGMEQSDVQYTQCQRNEVCKELSKKKKKLTMKPMKGKEKMERKASEAFV